MWSVSNDTPFAAERAWGRDKDGIPEWYVAVRGTFAISPDGAVTIADLQAPPLQVMEYHGEDGSSSIRYDVDVGAPKPTTDIVINGTAYAPMGRPSQEFLVSASVGPVKKVIKVVGNRTWEKGVFGLVRSAAQPVTKVPLVYERAYGGFDRSDPDPGKQKMDTRNPVGCGIVAQEGQSLPNFEYPSGRLDKAGPAGFGALATFWSPRRELMGTYDEAWRANRNPRLPEDWDPRSLLCSPADQRPEKHLRGGELVELENLTPAGRLSFALPKVSLRFRTRIDGRTVEHPGQLATVIIEPDHPRVILVWRSSLVVRTDGDYLDETIVSEKPRIR
jgi:hypothetical protein